MYLLQFSWPHLSPGPLGSCSWRALAATPIAMVAAAVTQILATPTFSVLPLVSAEVWHYFCYGFCNGSHIDLEPRLDLTRFVQAFLPPALL